MIARIGAMRTTSHIAGHPAIRSGRLAPGWAGYRRLIVLIAAGWRRHQCGRDTDEGERMTTTIIIIIAVIIAVIAGVMWYTRHREREMEERRAAAAAHR